MVALRILCDHLVGLLVYTVAVGAGNLRVRPELQVTGTGPQLPATLTTFQQAPATQKIHSKATQKY